MPFAGNLPEVPAHIAYGPARRDGMQRRHRRSLKDWFRRKPEPYMDPEGDVGTFWCPRWDKEAFDPRILPTLPPLPAERPKRVKRAPPRPHCYPIIMERTTYPSVASSISETPVPSEAPSETDRFPLGQPRRACPVTRPPVWQMTGLGGRPFYFDEIMAQIERDAQIEREAQGNMGAPRTSTSTSTTDSPTGPPSMPVIPMEDDSLSPSSSPSPSLYITPAPSPSPSLYETTPSSPAQSPLRSSSRSPSPLPSASPTTSLSSSPSSSSSSKSPSASSEDGNADPMDKLAGLTAAEKKEVRRWIMREVNRRAAKKARRDIPKTLVSMPFTVVPMDGYDIISEAMDYWGPHITVEEGLDFAALHLNKELLDMAHKVERSRHQPYRPPFADYWGPTIFEFKKPLRHRAPGLRRGPMRWIDYHRYHTRHRSVSHCSWDVTQWDRPTIGPPTTDDLMSVVSEPSSVGATPPKEEAKVEGSRRKLTRLNLGLAKALHKMEDRVHRTKAWVADHSIRAEVVPPFLKGILTAPWRLLKGLCAYLWRPKGWANYTPVPLREWFEREIYRKLIEPAWTTAVWLLQVVLINLCLTTGCFGGCR